MDLPLERGLPPIEPIQVVERPALSGGANSVENRLLSLLKQYRQEIKNGRDLDSVKRQIAQILVQGNLKLVDNNESAQKALKSIKAELSYTPPGVLEEFAEGVVRKVKALEDDELLKLIANKKSEDFNKAELLKIISKMPTKDIANLGKKLSNLNSSNGTMVRGDLDVEDLSSMDEIKFENRMIPKAPRAKVPMLEVEGSKNLELRIGFGGAESFGWKRELIFRLNCLEDKKMLEACKFLQEFTSKNVPQLRKGLYQKIIENCGKNNPVAAVRFVELLPRKIAIKALEELESKFFSNKNAKFFAEYKKRYGESGYLPMSKVYCDWRELAYGSSEGIFLGDPRIGEIKRKIQGLEGEKLAEFQKEVIKSVEKSQSKALQFITSGKESFSKEELAIIIHLLPKEEQEALLGMVPFDLRSLNLAPLGGARDKELTDSVNDSLSSDFEFIEDSFSSNFEFKFDHISKQEQDELYGLVKNSVKKYIDKESRKKNASLPYIKGLRDDYKKILKDDDFLNSGKIDLLLKMLPNRVVTKLLDKIESKFFEDKDFSLDLDAPSSVGEPLSKLYFEDEPFFFNLNGELDSLGLSLSLNDKGKLDNYLNIVREVLFAKKELQEAEVSLSMHYLLHGHKQDAPKSLVDQAKKVTEIRSKLQNIRKDRLNVEYAAAVYGIYERIVQKILDSDIFLSTDKKNIDAKQIMQLVMESKSDEDIKEGLFDLCEMHDPGQMKGHSLMITFDKLSKISNDLRVFYQTFIY